MANERTEPFEIELTQHCGKVELPATTPVPQSRYRAGELIDNRYEVDSLLGVGGMGEVYKVFDTQDGGHILALKLLLKDAINFADVKRFEREIEVTSKLNNPSVVNSFEHGEIDKRPYFTMEFIEGVTLRDLLGKDTEAKPLELQEILKILIQCASGLHHAHTQGVVHRDIKPENIMVTKDGVTKVADFGIGRSLEFSDGLTRTNEMVGTIFYMSPERLNGKPPVAQSDIYALGILAFELATGKRPFYDPDNIYVVYSKHLEEKIPSMQTLNPNVPSWFQTFVERCTEKEVKDRYASMMEVAQALLPRLTSRSRHDLSKLLARPAPKDVSVQREEPTLFSNYSLRESLAQAMLLRFNDALYSIKVSIRGGSPIRYAGALGAAFLHVFLLCSIPWLPFSGKIGSHIEPYAMDAWFAVRGEIAPPKGIFLVLLESQTYLELNESPLKSWPRSRMAELLEKIAAYQPKAVVLDYRFAGVTDPQDDSRFEKALSLSKTYLGKALSFASRREPDGTRTQDIIELHSDANFLKAAAGEFLLSRPIDLNIMRRFRNNDGTPVSIPEVVNARPNSELPGPGDFINYYGPPGTIISEPFYKVLNASPQVLEDNIRGKIIFVGQHMELEFRQQATDTFLTPYHLLSPGVEIHATAAGNVLDNSWIRRMSPRVEVAYAILSALVFGYILACCSPLMGLALLVGTIVGWATVSYILFLQSYFLPGITLVIFVLPLVYAGLMGRHFASSRALKDRLGLNRDD